MPLLGLGGFIIGGILAVVNPAWAGSLQTLLLIVLAIVTYVTNRNVKTTHGQNQEIKESVDNTHASVLEAKANATHAASAAAAAAAVARDSSRILKEVGGMFRDLRPPETLPATGPTGATDQGGGA